MYGGPDGITSPRRHSAHLNTARMAWPFDSWAHLIPCSCRWQEPTHVIVGSAEPACSHLPSRQARTIARRATLSDSSIWTTRWLRSARDGLTVRSDENGVCSIDGLSSSMLAGAVGPCSSSASVGGASGPRPGFSSRRRRSSSATSNCAASSSLLMQAALWQAAVLCTIPSPPGMVHTSSPTSSSQPRQCIAAYWQRVGSVMPAAGAGTGLRRACSTARTRLEAVPSAGDKARTASPISLPSASCSSSAGVRR